MAPSTAQSTDRSHLRAELLPPRPRLGVTAAFVLALGIIGTLMVLAEREFTRRTREATSAILAVIAHSQARAIEAHIGERISDMRVLSTAVPLQAVFAADPGDPGFDRILDGARVRLRQTAEAYRYDNIELFDARGASLAFLAHSELESPIARGAVQRAIETGAPQFVPLHRDGAGTVHYGITHPVRRADAPEGPVVGALYAVLLADDRLLPEIGAAPARGGSARVTLVQRDAGEFTVLHGPSDESLGVGVSVSPTETDRIAVQAFAVEGESTLRGRDYLGTEVHSYAVPIAGTPWVVASKVDVAEAELRIRAMRIAGLLVFLLLSAATALVGRMLWLQRRREYEAMQSRLGDRALRVVQTALDGYVELDDRGRFVEVNESTARMTGYPVDELLTMSLADVKAVRFGATEEAEDALARIRREGATHYQSRWRRRDGALLELDVNARYLPDEGGGRIVAFIRDITAQLAAQRRLERFNALYGFLNHASDALYGATTADAAYDAVCRIAVQDQLFLLAAVGLVDRPAGLMRMTYAAGRGSDAVPGITVSLAPDALEAGGPAMRALATRAPAVVNDYLADAATARFHALAERLGAHAVMCVPVLVEGEVVAIVHFYAGVRDFFGPEEVALLAETGRFLGVVLAAQRATAVQRAEEERFRGIFDASPMPMYVLDEPSGRLTRLNRAFTALFGYTLADIPTLADVTQRFYPDPAYRAHVLGVFEESRREMDRTNQSVSSPTLVARTKDGRERFVKGFATRVGAELIIGWIDLTELRESQHVATEAQAIARLTAWEYDFASGALHFAEPALRPGRADLPFERGIFDRILPEDAEATRARFDQAVRDRLPFDHVARYRLDDGTVRHLRTRMRVEYGVDGTPHRAVGTSQDVTEETVLAQELEAHRLNLERLVAARTEELARANAQLLITDKRLKAMLEMSKRSADLDESELLQLGIDEAVRLTGSAFGYVHLISDDQQRIEFNTWSSGTAEACTATYEAHYPIAKAGIWAEAVRQRAAVIHNTIEPAHLRHGYPDGHVALQRHLGVPLVEGDRVRLVVGVANKAMEYDASDAQELELVAHDIWSIVQRRRTESALAAAYAQVAASDERFAFAMAASNEGIWDWDLATDQVTYSDEYLKILGYAPGEFSARGGDWGVHLHPEDRDATLRQLFADLGQDGVSRLEFRIRRKDGTYVWGQTTGKVVSRTPDGRALRAVGTFVDLTARRAAEQELRDAKDTADAANRAKSSFLAVMSHEIRTPLNGVIGMAEVLAQSPLPVREADAVRTIRNSATNLLTLIDDILDFSKIEAGRLELDIADTDIHEVINGVIASLGPVAAAKHVDLTVFIAPDVPRRIRTDATRLRQIVFNLTGNAIKFSAGRLERLGRVAIRVERAAADPLCLRFCVRDNGIGISPEGQQRLFASFVQAEASTTRRYGGTGLGLAITRRLAELFGGRIGVESAVGVGSTFTVELPTVACEEQPARELPDVAGIACVIARGPGDFGQADDLATYLRAAGATVEIVEGADAAMRLARAGTPPVVLIEWTQPGDERIGVVAPHDQLRHLRITHGQRRAARVVAPNFVVLDQLALRELSFLRAVAIAAGRASPEVFHDEAEQPIVDPLTKPISIAEARAQGSLILVAEDDEINQKVLLRQLELLGYAAEVAADGAEALEMWRRGRYAMLITDLHMPEMDGYALTRAIRAEEPPTARLPILALTANALRGEEVRAREVGMDEYLTKPIRLKDLKHALHHWLRTDEQTSSSGPVGSGSEPASAATAPSRASGPAAPPAVVEAPAAVHPALDVEILKKYVGDDPEMIQEFLARFRDTAHEYHAKLTAAYVAHDYQQLANTAHTFKSSARAVGAIALGDLCADVESAAKRHDDPTLDECCNLFAREIDRVDRRLDELLGPTA